MTDTRPHFWFQIIEEIDANYEVLCAENLKNDVLYYYGFEEDETHILVNFDFTEYDDFYIAPHSVEYFVYDTPCFVVEENGYGEIMSIMEATGEYTLESISNAAPDYPYRVSNIFNYADGEGYIGEYTPSTVSWNINNKTVQSLHIGNKEIQTIERISDGVIIYQRTPVYELTLTSDKVTASTGETVTFSATLTLDGVTVSDETVTFTDGTNTLGTSTTNSNGVATLTYSWNTDSNLSIKSVYGNVESNSVNIEIETPSLKLTFTGSQFTPSSNANNVGLTGSDMIINWGDGTTEPLTSNTKLPTHTYQTSDTYTIRIQGEITGIGAFCFRSITGLTNITIPSGVTSLGNNCFGYTGLTSITIPSSVTSIGYNCFVGCTSLSNITIPSSVTSLGNSCFYGCTSLTDITIPSSITSLEYNCFYGCTSLTDITIPSSITSLGNSCFGNCNNLINYQLYWQTPPVSWSNKLMPNNTNTYFTIPNGTTANYVAKSFPSEKLIERSA